MSEQTSSTSDKRLTSLDAYRGLIMLTLASGGLSLANTAKNLGFRQDLETTSVTGKLWQFAAFHNSHPGWNSQFYLVGCSYWDLIQPSFMFMVGVAMPFSYAKRKARGDSDLRLFAHAAIRAIVLVLLGVFLASGSGPQTKWQFTNVLAQIGLGYLFVFLLLGKGTNVQLTTIVLILVGYWAAFVMWPPPNVETDLARYELTQADVAPGIAAHFTKHTNFAEAVDRWLLNLFPREKTHLFSPGGYATLNFVPSIATMLMGVLAGQLLRSDHDARTKLTRLILSGIVCMVVAVIASATVCPVIKRIWTPSWVLFSGAWTLWILAALYWVVDVRGWKAWTFPLLVLGTNSIAVYLIGQLFKPWTRDRLKTHFGQELFDGYFGPTVQSACIFVVFWLFCWWLYRQKIHFRI